MKTVHAIFEDGVFRPTEQIQIPEKAHVEFEPRIVEVAPEAQQRAMAEVFQILSRSYETGQEDLAARHDEHQP